MPIVRTTLRPDVEVEVGEADYLDLKRQGLLVEDALTVPAPAPQPTIKKTPAPTASGTTKEG